MFLSIWDAALRNKISSFQQHPGEAFCEAWERYKEYRRECPHHGFSDEQILGIFYDGVNWDYRTALNSASNGNFMTKSKEGAYQLIENLAASSSNKNPEYDRSVKVASVEAQKIEELTAKVNLLLKGNQKSVHFVDENGKRPLAMEFGEGQGFGQNRGFNQNQGGFQQTNPSNQAIFQAPEASIPAAQESKLESLMQQLMVNQQKTANEIYVKVDIMYQDLNNRFESLSAHVRKLEADVAQNAEAIKRQPGTLPEKVEKNPREHCHAVMVHGEVEIVPRKGSLEVVKEAVESEEHCMRVENVACSDDDSLDKKPLYTAPPPYVPKVPYPVPPKHLRKPITAEKLDVFDKMVRKLPPTMSFEEASEKHPLCDLFVNCREDVEEIKTLFIKARSMPPQMKQLSEEKDPGKFVVPCSIAGVRIEESLCDSGSSVNLMSKATAERLEISDIKPPEMILAFANSSTTIPYGKISNLVVQVGNCLVPTEFQVVEMSKDYEMPLILGRPFLATVGAVVDMPNKRISFSKIDKRVFYKAIPTNGATKHASCISIVDKEEPVVDSWKKPCEMSVVKEVMDGDPHITIKEVNNKENVKGNMRSKRIKGDPQIILLPQRRVGDTIEYGVKCKGTSKPFSKVRAILTSELKEKRQDVVKGLLSKVLKLKMSDCGACFGASFPTHPD